MRIKLYSNGYYKIEGFYLNEEKSENQKDFVWETHKGLRIKPQDMATQHLFYAVRMLFNNTVAPVFRIGEFRRYYEVKYWSTEYLEQAMYELATELFKRNDLGLMLTNQLNDMVTNAEVIKKLYS